MTASRSTPGREAAGVGRERRRQHRLDRARDVDAVRAPRASSSSARARAARGRRRRRCGSRAGPRRRRREAETASSKSRARDRVDGERVERGQVAAVRLDPLGRGDRVGGLVRRARASKPRSPPRSQISAAATSRALRRVADLGDHAAPARRGARRPPSRRRAPATPPPIPTCSARARTAARRPGTAPGARRPRRTGCAGARLRRAGAAARRRPRAPRSRRLVVARVFGSSATRTSGLRRPRRGSRCRRRSGTRRSSGRAPPPARQVDHLLEGPLAVGAGADDLGEVVLLQRRGQDLGRRGGVAVDEDHGRARVDRVARPPGSRGRPGSGSRSRRRCRPRAKMLGESTASLSSPPPLPRRSRTRPSAPLAVEPLDLVAQLAVGALAEGVRSGRRRPCRRRRRAGSSPSTAGTRTSARSSVELARLADPSAGTTRSSTSVPARALDLARSRPPRRRRRSTCPSTRDDQVALLDPGPLGGRVGKHARHPQPGGTSVTVSPTPEKRPEVAASKSSQLLGGEVVGELVVVALAQRRRPCPRSRRRRASPRSGSLEVVVLDHLARLDDAGRRRRRRRGSRWRRRSAPRRPARRPGR